MSLDLGCYLQQQLQLQQQQQQQLLLLLLLLLATTTVVYKGVWQWRRHVSLLGTANYVDANRPKRL